jgi:hypothetical protein
MEGSKPQHVVKMWMPSEPGSVLKEKKADRSGEKSRMRLTVNE